MHTSNRIDLLAPVGLLFLGAIPVLAGSLRLVQMSGGPLDLPDSERILSETPWVFAAHIVSSVLFSVLGAFQFSKGIRYRWPGWHRNTGRVLVVSGLIAALSGLWLSEFFPPHQDDGPLLYAIRSVVGYAMVVCLVLGLINIRRRKIPNHQAWMMRAYALGLGAGTQAFVILAWILTFGQPDQLERAILFGAGWGINVAFVEILLWRRTVI